MDLEELQVKLIACIGLQVVYWGACQQVVSRLSDDRMALAAFVVTLVISMITATVMLVKPK